MFCRRKASHSISHFIVSKAFDKSKLMIHNDCPAARLLSHGSGRTIFLATQSDHRAKLVPQGGVGAAVEICKKHSAHKWWGSTITRYSDGSHRLDFGHPFRPASSASNFIVRGKCGKKVSISERLAYLAATVTPVLFFEGSHRKSTNRTFAN